MRLKRQKIGIGWNLIIIVGDTLFACMLWCCARMKSLLLHIWNLTFSNMTRNWNEINEFCRFNVIETFTMGKWHGPYISSTNNHKQKHINTIDSVKWKNNVKSARRQIIVFYIQINDFERKDAMNGTELKQKQITLKEHSKKQRTLFTEQTVWKRKIKAKYKKITKIHDWIWYLGLNIIFMCFLDPIKTDSARLRNETNECVCYFE